LSGQNGVVVQNLHITNPNGDCVSISNSMNITIRQSEIGPCKGNGIVITNGNTINVFDNYIHPEGTLTGCCDVTDGIFSNNTQNLTVQGNVVAYGETNIEAQNQTGLNIIGNFLLNPRGRTNSRGQNVQVYYASSNVLVQNNYTLASTDIGRYGFAEDQEDSMDFGGGPSAGATTGIVAQNNYISGGHSVTGCGLTADTEANSAQFLNNTLVNTGQCGIGIADGTNQVVDGNKILNATPVNGAGNAALYVWKVRSSDPACGPVQISNNVASAIASDGSANSFWDGGGCDPVSMANNTFDAAAQQALSPASQTLPPPPIPPQPANCAIASPFTTSTALPACGSSVSTAPFGHVFVVVEENTNYSGVIGSSSIPYLNSLANEYGLATQYYADTHPSIGNYLMLTTGQIITNDDNQTPLTLPVSADNVVRELIASGKTWRQYAESIPSVGYLGDDSFCCGGQYYSHHVPLPYMTDAQAASQLTNIVPFTQFAKDLANNSLPNYAFITPNGCDDAHDCNLGVADKWLMTNIDPLIKSPLFQRDGLLIIVFDESATDNTKGGGQVAAVIVSPFGKGGYKSTTIYQHESVLRLMLEGLGVKRLPGAAATAPAMWEFFTFTPPS
jgi:acid phosphatase